MPAVMKMQNQDIRIDTNNCCNNNLIARCGGCGGIISDRYYLLAVDRQWHCQCLKCYHCGQQLESQLTCFSKAGFIYCKNDYYQLFSWQKCARCATPIQPKQLVMRISIDSDNSHYYHVDCFTCATCNEKLRKGDYFGKDNNNIYCQYHFQLLLDGKSSNDDECDKKISDDTLHKPKVRGRRKKTQKCDRMSSTSKTSSSVGSRSCSPAPSSTILSLSLSLKRPKRNRTSFKHQQLRAMKAYFNLNHNPDSKDLKQLSLKTGLPKRVLQVWFQNQRAKWRRSLLRQQSLGPQIVQECQPLAELNGCHLINSISCDEEQTIIEEEQTFATYTNLY